MQLLPQEEFAPLKVTINGVMLTNYRIRLADDKNCISIFLNEIASIEMKYSDNVLWFVIAFFGLIGSIFGFMAEEMIAILIGILAIIFGISMYKFSRKRKFIVTSRGGTKLVFSLQNIKSSTAMGLVDQIEELKVGI